MDLRIRKLRQASRTVATQKAIEIELLINNAGFGAFGYTQEIDRRTLAEMIQVNCAAVALIDAGITSRKWSCGGAGIS